VRRILARFRVLPVALDGIVPQRTGTHDATPL
jgi:hypothetical protein